MNMRSCADRRNHSSKSKTSDKPKSYIARLKSDGDQTGSLISPTDTSTIIAILNERWRVIERYPDWQPQWLLQCRRALSHADCVLFVNQADLAWRIAP